MQRDLAYLGDILDSARLAIRYVHGVDWERFAEDVQLQDSVIRRLEVIGEAARRCSKEAERLWPDLPWRRRVVPSPWVRLTGNHGVYGSSIMA